MRVKELSLRIEEYRCNFSKTHLKRLIARLVFKLFRTSLFIGMIYILIYPLLMMLTRSIRIRADTYNPTVIWIPLHYTLENFSMAMKLMEYRETLLLNIRVSVFSTLLTLASCSMAGYALARYKVPLKKFWIVMVVLTIVVPPQSYLIPIFFQFRFFNFFGIGYLISLFTGSVPTVNLSSSEFSYYMVSLLGMGIRSGLGIFLFYQFFRNMPKELEDAARIDGCGEARVFLRIMIPNAQAPFLVLFILSCVWYWNDTFFSTVMMRQAPLLANKLANVGYLIQMQYSGASYGDSLADSVIKFAAALLFILPPLIMYVFAQRFFMQSIERTGIVG